MRASLLLSLALTLTACGKRAGETDVSPARAGDDSATPAPQPERDEDPMTQQPESIGEATMKEDGTIVLQLRATADDGTVGDGLFTYAKDDPQYPEILRHLGGLQPGERKPVPPWPE